MSDDAQNTIDTVLQEIRQISERLEKIEETVQEISSTDEWEVEINYLNTQIELDTIINAVHSAKYKVTSKYHRQLSQMRRQRALLSS